ncbi:MAG: magnesium transporter [Rhizobiales bacterium]|nr:magnesium transporter [Hyphomicrobiales bacterium]NRB15746.1 magnesium transporter [Hyphomicrobiales bacterium]
MAVNLLEFEIRDVDERLSAEFIAAVTQCIKQHDVKSLTPLLVDMHDADLADFIEILKPAIRLDFFRLMGTGFDFSVLTELDESIRDELIELLPNNYIANELRELDSDDQIHVLEDLDENEKVEILAHIPVYERRVLEHGLDYPEDSAGRLMQNAFISVPPFWTVKKVLSFIREDEKLPDEFFEIFVTDANFHYLGSVPLDVLVRSAHNVVIEKIMDDGDVTVAVTDDQEDVALQFERYNLISTPVLDDGERLVGVVTIDDVVDVIREEAEEDMNLMAGVGTAESLSDSVMSISKARFIWLFVNLVTAILASIVIGMYGGTIEQMVSLAVLMPIVASMGGNAGTQTMTVAVRAIATRELTSYNMFRVVSREVLVGGINGLLFAIIVAIVTYVWFGNIGLSAVIFVAMMLNMVIAAFAGILIPLSLDKLGADPALASSVFLTTVTDVVGFVAFLSLATAFLI